MRSRFAVPALAFAGAVLLGLAAAQAQDKKEEKEVTILSPKEGSKVSQYEEIDGRLDPKKGWPVLLVQPLAPGQPWWIQATVEDVTDGKFTAKAQFGDDKTKGGAKFRVVVVLAKDKAAAEKFEAGTTKNSLPPGLPRSEYLNVVRAD
jgi:hypothetical protein